MLNFLPEMFDFAGGGWTTSSYKVWVNQAWKLRAPALVSGNTLNFDTFSTQKTVLVNPLKIRVPLSWEVQVPAATVPTNDIVGGTYSLKHALSDSHTGFSQNFTKAVNSADKKRRNAEFRLRTAPAEGGNSAPLRKEFRILRSSAQHWFTVVFAQEFGLVGVIFPSLNKNYKA